MENNNATAKLDPIEKRYFDNYASQLQDRTKKQYLSVILEAKDTTGVPFYAIQASEAEKYYMLCTEKIKAGKAQGSTVYKKFVILSGFSDYILNNLNIVPNYNAIEYTKNPFSVYLFYLKQFATSNKAKIMSLQEIDKLLEAAQSDLLTYACITSLYRTAIKPSDLCSIRVCDILDPDNDYWIIATRKNKVDKPVFFPADAVQAIKIYMEANNITTDDPDAYLFINKHHKQLKERDLERRIKKLCEKAGIKSYSPYAIRNASGSLLYAYGADDAMVADQLGILTRHVRRYKSSDLEGELFKTTDLVNLTVNPPRV